MMWMHFGTQGSDSMVPIVTALYAGGLLIVPGLLVVTCGWASHHWGHISLAWKDVICNFAPALVPEGFSMWLAHFLQSLGGRVEQRDSGHPKSVVSGCVGRLSASVDSELATLNGSPFSGSGSAAYLIYCLARGVPSRQWHVHCLDSTLVSMAGFVELWFETNALTAMLGLFTLLSYLFLYTPLKWHSPICTTVGAVPGAMPPLIGYAAASGHLDSAALALFAILFVWQFPHFDAIAWMYREDYARGGIRMLPVIHPNGAATAKRILACSVLLISVSLLPGFLGMTGPIYFTSAIAAGMGLLYFGVRLGRERTRSRARHVLLASVLYLPAILAVMVIDRQFP